MILAQVHRRDWWLIYLNKSIYESAFDFSLGISYTTILYYNEDKSKEICTYGEKRKA